MLAALEKDPSLGRWYLLHPLQHHPPTVGNVMLLEFCYKDSMEYENVK